MQDFEEIRKLGRGSFGSVMLARKRLDGIYYAVKKISKRMHGDREKEHHLHEAYALSVLDNKHIVRYYNCWIEEDHLFVQMEYCENGSLADHIGQVFSEHDIRSIMSQVLEGLSHMHSMNIVHMDIKSENIYIGKNNIFKIGDLGQTTWSTPRATDISEGDARYLAREVLEDDYQRLDKADIFSLGATVYELIVRRTLPSNGAEWHALRDGQLLDICEIGYSRDLHAILLQMMHPDPQQRPSAAALLRLPYFAEGTADSMKYMEQRCRYLQEELQKVQHMENYLRSQLERASQILSANGLSLPAAGFTGI
jgi:wee1-like protein kinase